MVTALFARTLEELQNLNELTTSSQAYIHIQIAQDKIQWQAIVNTMMNVDIPSKVGNFLTSQSSISVPGMNLLLVVRFVDYLCSMTEQREIR